jgi:CHASE2 domain-containing sensor protein
MKSLLRSKFATALAWSAVAIASLFAIFYVHLLNHAGIDDWIERRFLQYAAHSANTALDDRVMLITIDPARPDGLGAFDDGILANQQWRAHHAKLLANLAAAKVRLVAFDLSFPAPDPKYADANTALVEAIRKLNTEGGMTTLVGFERDMDDNPALEAVLPREKMGLVSMREMTLDADSDQYLARVLLAESTLTPTALGTEERILRPLPMPLAMYLADQRPERGEARLSIDSTRGALVVRWERGDPTVIDAEIRSCERSTPGCRLPRDAGPAAILQRAVLPLWMGRALTFTESSYASVLNQSSLGERYQDRVVLVGALTAREKQQVGPGAPKDPVFGMHVHARVFSDLVTGSYLRHASAWLQLASIVLVLLAGLLARLYMPIKVVKIPIGWLKDFPLPVGFFLVAGVYLFIAALIFRSRFVFFDLGYQLLALAVGYYAIPALAGLASADTKESAK